MYSLGFTTQEKSHTTARLIKLHLETPTISFESLDKYVFSWVHGKEKKSHYQQAYRTLGNAHNSLEGIVKYVFSWVHNAEDSSNYILLEMPKSSP